MADPKPHTGGIVAVAEMTGGPGNTNEIQSYMHCRLCMSDIPDDVSPQEYARLEVGCTPNGIQVWCTRHDVNVCHIHFEGSIHPANLTIRRPHPTAPQAVN
jgi:hypothetical protein